ncbi:ubiquinone biosynthesis regulatory protein kinase UbiB [Microbulbifer thermotolerans]|uniref:ubiquinone biosynthesis regulatory protein kinase UbiB n=1 Tax=Microbulbifer thermotolerans TaxID=252514 RepID=UPI002673B560|nr:ubiquinone biosynthesis regulatory protein kinase UbiB [Microbulbifer thermotolerans]WKT60453.1 ubiquinone biosynthesis regulatory protein kinase UbiB [Microbulbifer thermotolerans]
MPVARSFTIARVFLRYRLDQLLPAARRPLWLRGLLSPLKLMPESRLSRGARLRRALEELGPIFVKFGQLLSTRPDLLPADIVEELDRLQDKVPPFPSEECVALIEQALGASVDELFADFDRAPLASASVAQVHSAVLLSGEQVVVKVLRPGIEKIIEQDLRLLAVIARWIERWVPDGRRLRPVEVVEDYRHTIEGELDLVREAANGTQLKRNFANSPLLYVPEVYWDYTRQNVLVLERIDGIPVTDIAQLRAQNTDMKLLAERGVEIFFKQVFEHNFFHADMHPGNIFVSRKHPQRPQYIAIDTAIVGSLSREDQYYLARNLLAMFRRDYRMVAELHVQSGWVRRDTPVNSFEAAIRAVCEPIFEKPLGEISFARVLISLFQTARRFDMAVQPQLVLLQKTLLNIEGLGRQLYPQLDLWKTAHPFLERWMRERIHPRTIIGEIKRYGPEWLEKFPQLPQMVFSSLEQSRDLAPQLQSIGDKLAQSQHRGRGQYLRRVAGVLLAAGAVALASSQWAAHLSTGTWVMGAAALVLLLWP